MLTNTQQDTAIYIVAPVLAVVTLLTLIWLIALQSQLSKVKRLVKKLNEDELRRRGYEEYNGQKQLQQPIVQPQQPMQMQHQPVQQHQQPPYSGQISIQDTRPPLQSQYSAQQYTGHGPSSSASSIVRGQHEFTPPTHYQQQGYERDRRDRGFSPATNGVQVFPRDDSELFQDHRGNFVLKSPPNKYGANTEAVKDFAKDVATDVAKDLAKDGLKEGWGKMWG